MRRFLHGSTQGQFRNSLEATQKGFDFIPSIFPEPTTAPPGSLEKLNVLADRLRNGAELWHPLDRLERENKKSYLK